MSVKERILYLLETYEKPAVCQTQLDDYTTG